MAQNNILPFPVSCARLPRPKEKCDIDDFAAEYDNFISGMSPTEEYANYIRDVAQHFFLRGYSLGQDDSHVSGMPE